MTIAFYMNCVSTHQLPLARELARRVDELVYVYEGLSSQEYQRAEYEGATRNREILEKADVVYSGLRDVDLFERRARKGLTTFYTSERWFKPRLGALRMLIPQYRKMAKRFAAWANGDPRARILAIGPWARQDFLRMKVDSAKIVSWGYFVSPGNASVTSRYSESDTMFKPGSEQPMMPMRVLWAGRDLPWKRVRDIECAVERANQCLARSLGGVGPWITFTKMTGVTPSEVREAMRLHDVYVLASDAQEGWGCVLNEALEENMSALGTYEAGASSAMLPASRLYHAGDVKALAGLLEKSYFGMLPRCSIGEWTAEHASNKLMDMLK